MEGERMFRVKTQIEDPGLQKEIDALLLVMDDTDKTSDEYAKLLSHLTKLYNLKEDNSKRSVSADTKAVVLGNLVGILMIVGHERAHVVTSKALNFVMKAR
jgi:hypothetical protein